jgi:two-component sensor histidine kinase
MGHRVKNAFTVVNGIVGMSARYAKGQTLVRDIQARLAALARAHDLTRPGRNERCQMRRSIPSKGKRALGPRN